MADANSNLGFSTDWVTDMGLYATSVSQTVANGTGSFDVITHGLGYKPVCDAQWNVSPSTKWFPAGGGPAFSGTAGYSDKYSVNPYFVVTTTKIVCYYNNSSGANRTISVRVWVYENPITEEI